MASRPARIGAANGGEGGNCGTGGRLRREGSDVNLLGDSQLVIDLDAQISNGAFDLSMAKQQLDRPKVVRSLEDMGYILATANRDYVLVDLYGSKKALVRLIDDKKVCIKDEREFLGKDFPKDALPTVEEARGLAAVHRAAMELFEKNEHRAARETREKQRREDLQRRQQPRRQGIEVEEGSFRLAAAGPP
jgi:hypothetical protein